MNQKSAIKVLVRHAKGIISHRYEGNCPDTVEGADVRDSKCSVCNAIKAMECKA